MRFSGYFILGIKFDDGYVTLYVTNVKLPITAKLELHRLLKSELNDEWTPFNLIFGAISYRKSCFNTYYMLVKISVRIRFCSGPS